jgi:DMSO/TMAO reductase YedYZ molybdopterin-dependent catalytic subunit
MHPAGNRRKEENMVKQTIGFNWGPSGTSCSTWTGVRVSDLLTLCGVKDMDQGAHHVCFRGPKGEQAPRRAAPRRAAPRRAGANLVACCSTPTSS